MCMLYIDYTSHCNTANNTGVRFSPQLKLSNFAVGRYEQTHCLQCSFTVVIVRDWSARHAQQLIHELIFCLGLVSLKSLRKAVVSQARSKFCSPISGIVRTWRSRSVVKRWRADWAYAEACSVHKHWWKTWKNREGCGRVGAFTSLPWFTPGMLCENLNTSHPCLFWLTYIFCRLCYWLCVHL